MEEPAQPALGRRARKAMATRHRVLDAAETLFVRDGYAATTIASVAEEADVAVQTVYAVFGTKRAILSELLAVRVAGDDDAIPVQGRGPWQAIEREPDPRGSSPCWPPRSATASPASTRSSPGPQAPTRR